MAQSDITIDALSKVGQQDAEYLVSLVRSVPGFPKEGIIFRDFMPVLADPKGLKILLKALEEALPVSPSEFDSIAGLESRGFLFGPAMAAHLGKGFIAVRKAGKLPPETIGESYDLEYGTASVEIETDAVQAGKRVLIVDDLIATGGTEVEEIAKEHPEAVKRLHIDALGDFDLAAATEMAQSIGFYHADVDQAAQVLLKMWRCFKDNDATLVEINPLAKIGDPDDESTKQLSALDAKISLDDNASFRHDGWARFVDPIVPDPFEQRAREHGLHYVHLHGEVGVIGNGAGLVMSSLDAVSGAGEEQGTNIKPANFLDIGGGASAAVMAESLEIVLSDPQVESVFINVYGGITSCVEVANGILEAVAKLGGSKPIVVRFDGNAAAEGLHILASANNPNIHVSETMEGAAAKAAQLAGEATQSKEVR